MQFNQTNKNQGDVNNLMNETFGSRETVITVLRNRAQSLERKANRLRALATALEEIERSSHVGVPEGSEGKHPYIGVGSEAEQALWEMAQEIRT